MKIYKNQSVAKKGWITRKGKQKRKAIIKTLLWIIFISSFIGIKITHNLNTISIAKAEAPYTEYWQSLPENEDKILDPEQRYYYLLKHDENFIRYINGISIKRNNPGNLRYAGQPNSVDNNGFAYFPSIQQGFRGLIKQLELDQSRNLTLEDFLYKYAPPHENRTEQMITNMTNWTTLKRYENIKKLDTIFLAQAITRQEWGIKW